jgi:GNAT superfamily N-acetyltransferase
MNQMMLRTATLTDRALIRSISERTWPSTYGHIISQEQIDFMLDWMYSDESLATQMNTGCEFYIASMNGDDVGFCSVGPEEAEEAEEKKEAAEEAAEEKGEEEGEEEGENNCTVKAKGAKAHKLNKLYVLPAAQGTGAGKALLNKSIEVAKAAGSSSLFLQVNKQNSAYTFYIKHGFVKEREFKFDIGNGFFMDDYVMRLSF